MPDGNSSQELQNFSTGLIEPPEKLPELGPAAMSRRKFMGIMFLSTLAVAAGGISLQGQLADQLESLFPPAEIPLNPDLLDDDAKKLQISDSKTFAAIRSRAQVVFGRKPGPDRLYLERLESGVNRLKNLDGKTAVNNLDRETIINELVAYHNNIEANETLQKMFNELWPGFWAVNRLLSDKLNPTDFRDGKTPQIPSDLPEKFFDYFQFFPGGDKILGFNGNWLEKIPAGIVGDIYFDEKQLKQNYSQTINSLVDVGTEEGPLHSLLQPSSSFLDQNKLHDANMGHEDKYGREIHLAMTLIRSVAANAIGASDHQPDSKLLLVLGRIQDKEPETDVVRLITSVAVHGDYNGKLERKYNQDRRESDPNFEQLVMQDQSLAAAPEYLELFQKKCQKYISGEFDKPAKPN
ncbi:hypothetical protein M1403_00445 [Patescibacteria group bacterium]|nr:hypothetical protein [Patescibacteria group bacterium]